MINKRLSKTELIDFDYFISGVDLTMDNEEERLLYLNHIEPELKNNEKNKHEEIVSLWIKVKRNQLQEMSPGRLFNAGFRLIFFIVILTALLTGAAAAISYLSYSGTRPVNIAIYLFVFVFTQIFLQIVTVITLISSRFSFLSDFFNTPYSLVLLAIKKTATRGSGKISAEKKLRIAASMGKIKINRERYGKIYFWTIFKIFQFTGLMFSTGVLIATLFKIITSDLAFGWQTTIQTAPEKIYGLVQWFSIPWSWLVPTHLAFPGLNQIKGSQILLKESIVHLVSSDMAAWWPFLCFAVIFYTMIPRVFLILAGIFFEQKELKNTIINNRSSNRLIHLLTSAHLIFEKSKANGASVLKTDTNFISPQRPEILSKGEKLIVLIPEDIFSETFVRRTGEKIRQNLGEANEIIRITGDADEDHELIKSMTEKVKPCLSFVILVVYEAWLPPIKENIDYLQKIRRLAGKKAEIIVWLTGKPLSGSDESAKIRERDFKVWNWKIQTMGDNKIVVTRPKTLI